jgi:hypothetical protein
VLIVYQDTKYLRDYSSPQKNLIDGPEVRAYLDAKCVVGPDGKTPERRIWDHDANFDNAPELWKAARKRVPNSLDVEVTQPNGTKQIVPTVWLIVSNGKEGWEGPIPPSMSDADIMALLKKYGG